LNAGPNQRSMRRAVSKAPPVCTSQGR
jgi:hypothetical protein